MLGTLAFVGVSSDVLYTKESKKRPGSSSQYQINVIFA